MKIRSAVPKDLAGIVRLLNEVDIFYGDDVTESAEQRSSAVSQALFSATPFAYTIVAELGGGELAGFAAYSFLWPAAGSTASLYLKELYVTGSSRRTGVGRSLFVELCSIAIRLGMSRVELTTDRSNTDAQRFYGQLGLSMNDGKILYRLEGDHLRNLR